MSELHTRETDSELESWRSTGTLPDETRERVHKLLGEAVQDMDHLDRIISEKEADLARLYQKREADNARISTLRGVITKTGKLPPEILSEVFTHACAGSQVLLPPGKRECRWAIGHVCSHWRQVLWSTPAVWADICIRLQENEPPMVVMFHGSVVRILKHIFAQTNALFSLTVRGCELAVVYDTILQHTHRFKGLSLFAINWKILSSIMTLPSELFSNLETLQISVDEESSLTAHSNPPTSPFQHAPNLRSVTYTGHVFKPGPRTPNRVFISGFLLLPWEQLTDLSVTFMPIPPAHLHSVFSRCSALVSCKVLCTGDLVIPPKHPITLPCLEKLEVSTNYYHETIDWVNFLQPLVTPALREITIRALTMSCQAFTSLITRSKCSLVALHLHPHDIKFQDPHVQSMLPHLGSLTTICLGFPIEASVIKMIKDGLLPSLDYGEWVVHPDGWEAVLDLIDSRIQQRFSTGWKLRVDLVCLGGRGFQEVRDRYLRRFKEYRGIQGLRLSFWGAEESEEIEPDNDKYP
ncbi:hypothetical protein BDZ94DRAFT_1271100 [Collybia nuda]|uniref:F-box domain-containing protein n=1 Tax=Collybia nuda TaxID=64659 RepID=A0A9P5XVB9_9AGAR|nr:hypothetical protein BDZ94DRAFT_1271100 [Collybia nuda]